MIFFTHCFLDDIELEILAQQQRRNQEERGDDVEIPDSLVNNEFRSENPYYTDEDEPYIPTENPMFVRTMSDSSLDSDLRQVNDQYEEGLTDEMLRFANNDLSQITDPDERPIQNNLQPGLDAEGKSNINAVFCLQ